MKKRNRIKWIITVIVLTIILGGAFIVIRKLDINTVSASEIKSQKDNSLTFECGYFNDYVHIALKMEKSENIKEELGYQILDSDNKVVYQGKLSERTVSDSYDGKKGEWKIKFDFNNENEKAMIKYNIAVDSKENY